MSKHSPGPWEVGYRTLTVQAPSEKGGTFPICDIRGWGYLTGNGSGALGLAASEAESVQNANASLIAAAPDLLSMLKVAQLWLDIDGRFDMQGINAAIAKAEGRGP